MSKIENAITITYLVGQFIKETGYKLKSIEKEIDVCDIFDFDEENNRMINYGNVDDIINLEEFKKWYSYKYN